MKQKYCQTKSTQSPLTRERIANAWFITCERDQIPCIRLHRRGMRANIYWDYLSYPRAMDNAFSGKGGEQLRACVLDMFRRVVEEHSDPRMTCIASSDTVHLEGIPGKVAENIASELYDMIVRHCDEFMTR
ncbi:TPA: hypothetical protein ACQJL1_003150 [Citrobacter freundii]